MSSVTSPLVHLLTVHPSDPELVAKCINEQDWGPCWLFQDRRKHRDDRPSINTNVTIRRKTTTRHAYLFQQLMVIPRMTLFEIRREYDCDPFCFNPWHCSLVELERLVPKQGVRGTRRWTWEWPEVNNRYELFRSIVNGRVTANTVLISLEEFYEKYATEEEKEARASKKLPPRGRRGRRPIRGSSSTHRNPA